MKIKINETFRSMAGSPEFHNEYGILQEAPENIIPPAFNRLVAYARMGGTVPNEAAAGLGLARAGDGPDTPEEREKKYKEFLDKRVEKFGLPRAAQDTFAQLIVRYAGRSYTTPRGGSVDFALNPAGVQLVFTRAFRELRGDVWWQAYYKNALNKPNPLQMLDPSSEQLKAWRKEEEKIDNWIEEEWGRRSTTAFKWTKKAREMAAEGAKGPELLIFMGRQYKSNIKSLKKWFKRNPMYADVQAPLLEAVRKQWNRWQHQIINHAQGNLRKIGQYMKDNPNSYSSFNALIKKHPTTGQSSLFHIGQFIDKELLKGQLDSCRNGWASADQGNAEDATDMSAPCVLHEYDDGFFWWNRRAASCDIAGDEMANCGSSNYDDSTLLILKEFVQNDSMDAKDKMKPHLMVEYNSARGSIEQVLGFANSFPEKKYWKYIKDLYDNLNVQELSKWALKHLRDRKKTTQDEIDAFVEFVEGGTGVMPPEFFFAEEGEDSFIQRIKERKYNLESEANFGGRQAILFKAVHEQAEVRWKPIEVELNIRPLYYPQAPESLSTEEHPSIDPLFFENRVENRDKLKEILQQFIKLQINDVMVNANVVSGENAKLAKTMFESFEFLKFDAKKRTDGGLRMLVRAAFDIPPEVFTDESSLAADVPIPQSAHAIVNKVKQNFGGDRLLRMLNNSIMILNSQLNPEEYTEFIPGVDDQEDGQVILNVGEITMEMDAIRRDFERGVSLDQMNQRLEILYTSLASPRDDDSGYMNIDAIHHTIADIWERWIEDDDYWSAEWFRLRRDSRQRVAAMRDELDDDQWADLSLPTEVTPGLPPGADQQANMQGYFPDDDDGPDEEERNWRPGMPTPGLRATDYEDPADIERDQARYVDFDNDEDSEADRLYQRGALLLRFFAANPERVNDGAVRLFQRFKNEMEQNGLWDEWWSQVPNDHPVANVLSGLQEDRIMVETNKILGEKKSGVEGAHINEDNSIRKGGVLPFKQEEGEFYFLLGQAPQGWWSDFRGGEETEDGGDLKVTAAREFTEESSFELAVELEDGLRIEHKNAAVYLADLAEINVEDFDINKVMKINKGYLAGTPEIVAVQWYHIRELPQIPRSRMPIIEKAIQMLTAPEPSAMATGVTHGRPVGGDAYTPFLNESTNITTLHIFDFDDTIAFTETHTIVTAPNGRKYKVDQAGLDKLLKSVDGGEDELRSKGFDLDFSGFKTVSPDSQLNPVIARRIDACCLAGDRDPNGDFYVLTARAAAAEGAIHQYLADNNIEIDRSKVIGVEGKSKASRIKSLITGSNVSKIIFYDDSNNNINDVASLRQDPDLQDVVFELYPVDEEGNIPEKPMQETIYERKRFKIRIGAKR